MTSSGSPVRSPPDSATPGLTRPTAWTVADLVRVLLSLARPSRLGGPASDADARLIEAWLGDPSVRAVIGVNTWEGVEYLDRDRFADLLRWASRLEAIEAGTDPGCRGALRRLDSPLRPRRRVSGSTFSGLPWAKRRRASGEERRPLRGTDALGGRTDGPPDAGGQD